MVRKMKKVYLLILIIIVSITTISCESGENKIKNESENYKIGVLMDAGNIDNEKIVEALNKGKEDFKVNYDLVVCADDEEYEKNIKVFAKGNYSLIIGTSQECRWSIEKMALKYPQKKFLIIDSVIDSDNVQSIIFKENEGAYLLGLIAGMTSSTNEIAFIGGKDILPINQLEIGFVAGVYSVNKEAGIKLIKKDNAEYLNSFIDVNNAYKITQRFINKNCDIIYAATGGATFGVYTCVNEKKEKGKDVFIIGENIGNEDLKTEFKGMNLATLEKKSDNVIYSVIEELSKNQFSTGAIYEIGIIDEGIDIKNNMNGNIKDEISNIINENKKNIINGNIVVPSTYEELKKQITENKK